MVLVVVVAAACGGDDDDAADADEPTASAEEEAIATPADTTDETDGNSDTDGAGEASDDGEQPPEEEPTPTPDPDGIPDGDSAIPTPTQAPVSGDPAFTAASKLSTVGLDELFFGDPVDFAAEVAETTWVGLAPEGERPQCYTVQPATGPAGIFFTVVDGFVERVDITNPIITTRSGAGVGFAEAGLTELFGDSLETAELEGGREITFVPSDASDRDFRIVWVTDGNAVVSMRAGRVGIVTPSSPCG